MNKDKDSYKQIFRSTSLVGGTQILKIAVGVARTKFVALFLGPVGVGIDGMFQAIVELVKNATGFGINFSAVKSIAEDSADNDTDKVGRTITIVRRWALGTGLLGALVVLIGCRYFSQSSFGNNSYTKSIALLSITLLLASISAGQLALLQGLRRIGHMSKATLLAIVSGTILALPLYWWLGLNGIVPGMIVIAVMSLVFSWLYSKDIIVTGNKPSYKETFKGGLGMAKLGFFIVINGFVATAAMYAIRALIRQHQGVEFVGYFQSVWTISTFYINILLTAMLADYFPRLSMIQNDNAASNRLINEQLEMTMLIGAPMLMGMIAFAPLAINVLYSKSFYVAVPVLKMQMAASFFTLVSWPIGVLFLSKDRGGYAMGSETLRQCIFIAIVFWGWQFAGFNILGIAFLAANFINTLFVFFSANRISEFKFSVENKIYLLGLGAAVLLTTCTALLIEGISQYLINAFLLLITGSFCLLKLNKLLDFKGMWAKRQLGGK